ncbi:MAG: hypothetical protein HZB41_13550 [Ignavibacteriae bacterium]|nr:hypothetical protein [Ignavibacteriota bacterium]
MGEIIVWLIAELLSLFGYDYYKKEFKKNSKHDNDVTHNDIDAKTREDK